jgi:lambda family phage minor tail protein L
MNQVLTDIQKLSPGSLVIMYVIDASSIPGGGLNYFHPGTNGVQGSVVWQGTTYLPFPMEITGFDATTNGTPPRPTATVANVNGLISSLMLALGDMVGAKVTRKRTFVKYLDAVNFPDQVNPTADPTSAFQDETFYVLRKQSEDNQAVVFELGTALDLEGELLPGRQIVANICWWQYRDGQCPYVGGAVATNLDVPTGLMANDDCSKTIAGCRLRFPAPATLPFGSFPGAGVII